MEQRIHDHFREVQCMLAILEKPVAFVVKIAKISIVTNLLYICALTYNTESYDLMINNVKNATIQDTIL
jgi:hypothetical protein